MFVGSSMKAKWELGELAEQLSIDMKSNALCEKIVFFQPSITFLFRNVQQRLSYSLLSDIAAALLDDAVFTIVGKLPHNK